MSASETPTQTGLAPGPEAEVPDVPPAPRSKVPLFLGVGTLAVLALGALLFQHGRGSTNDVTLASQPKPVTVVPAAQATYRPTRRYVGTVEPWLEARIGPQLVSPTSTRCWCAPARW